MLHIKKVAIAFRKENEHSVAGRIHIRLLNAQRKVADYLNRKTAGWSPRKIKIMLIVFCLVTGTAALYIMCRAIVSATGPPKSTVAQRPPLQPHLTVPGIKSQKPDPGSKNIHLNNKKTQK